MSLTEQNKLELLRQAMLAGKRPGGTVNLSRHLLGQLLDLAFDNIVDDAWYLARYPDVAEAIAKGQVSSPREHFTQAGLYEGRVPYEIGIDSTAYLRKHHDVAASVKNGTYADGKDHFLSSGFAEGRAFTLASGQ